MYVSSVAHELKKRTGRAPVHHARRHVIDWCVPLVLALLMLLLLLLPALLVGLLGFN
jgi:hypothetical protein